MKRGPKTRPDRGQTTSKQLTDSLLDFLRRKFYVQPGDERRFLQDRSRLLAWVVLWPAGWLNGRGVTLHPDDYREIFHKVFLQADMHRSDRIKYRPAWLRMVIQSHFRVHGEEHYEAAKSMRSVAEKILLFSGRAQAAPDPVKEMAAARKILRVSGGRKTGGKAGVDGQLNLL